jgi:hypothetical protein
MESCKLGRLGGFFEICSTVWWIVTTLMHRDDHQAGKKPVTLMPEVNMICNSGEAVANKEIKS